MVVSYTFQCTKQRINGWLGLLRVAAELLRQVAFHAFAQCQEFAQRSIVTLIELTQVQGGVAGAFDLIGGAVQIQNEGAWHDTNQDQHDQADAFLAIVGAVYKAHSHSRDHQNQTVPERRVLFVIQFAALLWRLVHLGGWAPPLKTDQ